MNKIGILGAKGRVGQLLIRDVNKDIDLYVGALFAKDAFKDTYLENLRSQDMKDFINSCDGIIDFSLPSGNELLMSTLLDTGTKKPVVSGTTGLNSHQQNLIKEASKLMPICYSTNMSLGIAVLNKIVQDVAKTLEEFDCEIVEHHHRLKKDAPSGTALTLAEHVADARNLDIDVIRVSGRDGSIGERRQDEIGVMALRGGDVVGRHTVGFYNEGEFLELNHTATSRETFSKGAISIYKWLVKQEPKLYSINDYIKV